MKKRKGFTLVELIGAMAIMVILMDSFGYLLVGSATTIKQDKQRVKAVSYSQFIMQTFKSYGKSYYANDLNIQPPADPAAPSTITSGYFYFNDKNELSNTITKDNIKSGLSGAGTGIYSGTYDNMINNAGGHYGAYFEFSNSAIMGNDLTTGTGNIVLQGYESLRLYIKVVDLESVDKYSSNLTFYLGR